MATQLLELPPQGEASAFLGTPRGFSGTVRAVTHRVVAVDHEDGSHLAKRAASCLLAPEVGDSVLCGVADGSVYVLAVLERASSEREQAIEVDGDLCVRSREGSVRIEAGEGEVELRAGTTARVAAPEVAVAADKGSWVGRELRLLGEHLSLSAVRISQESEYAERIAHSLKERFGKSYRDVEEEHVRADSLTHSVRHLLRTHAETVVTTAKKLIKLDGDQIHLG